ncbi:MAG: hypothetical protein WCE70_10730, partial [Rhodanobacteraceae bacterium]
MKPFFALTWLASASIICVLAGCGGSSNSSSSAPPPTTPPPPAPPPAPTLDPQYLASAPSPFANNCDGVAPVGTLYVNAEVEPSLTLDPTDGSVL